MPLRVSTGEELPRVAMIAAPLTWKLLSMALSTVQMEAARTMYTAQKKPRAASMPKFVPSHHATRAETYYESGVRLIARELKIATEQRNMQHYCRGFYR